MAQQYDWYHFKKVLYIDRQSESIMQQQPGYHSY